MGVGSSHILMGVVLCGGVVAGIGLCARGLTDGLRVEGIAVGLAHRVPFRLGVGAVESAAPVEDAARTHFFACCCESLAKRLVVVDALSNMQSFSIGFASLTGFELPLDGVGCVDGSGTEHDTCRTADHHFLPRLDVDLLRLLHCLLNDFVCSVSQSICTCAENGLFCICCHNCICFLGVNEMVIR